MRRRRQAVPTRARQAAAQVATLSPRPRLALALAAGIGGAALLSLPAAYYRIDRVSCASWPPRAVDAALGGAYLAALALLALCWLVWWAARPRLGSALGAGVAVHAVALAAPPFLSLDPLFYAAIGRAMARYHGSPYASLDAVLPAGDPFLRALGPDWQRGTSAYFAGWNAIAEAVAWLGGDRVTLQLRIYQALGLLALVACAALVGVAVRARAPERAGSAAAAVLLCPLGVVEATLSGHNDALLALAVALLALATARGRTAAGVAAAATGLAVKASGLLVAGMVVLAPLAAWAAPRATRHQRAEPPERAKRPERAEPPERAIAGRPHLAPTWLWTAALLVLASLVLAASRVTALASRWTALFDPASLLCDRALECIPRWLLWLHGLRAPAFALGLAVRAVGVAWLARAGLRAGVERDLLPWLARGLLGYYLLFHGYFQAWYLLPVVPLLPFVAGRTRAVAVAACLAALCHDPLWWPFNCRLSATELWVGRGVDLALLLLPPALAWSWVTYRSRRSRRPTSS